jgi:hypothetical protein
VDKAEFELNSNLLRIIVEAGISASLHVEWGRARREDPMYEIRTFSGLDFEAMKNLVGIAERNDRMTVEINSSGQAVIRILPLI